MVISTAVKSSVAIALIFVAGGAWIFLDCMNKQEQMEAEMLRQGMVQSRAETNKRVAEKAAFESRTLNSLNMCNDSADQIHGEYMKLVEQLSPRKRGKTVIAQEVSDATEKLLADSKAACQKNYESLM